MQTLLLLDIDPPTLTAILDSVTSRGQVLAVRTLEDGLAPAPARDALDLVTVRALLTARGLTPRQCDLVLLDLQGHTRADIAARCGISPATVKKYWLAIYTRLGIQQRQILRVWVLAQCGVAIDPSVPMRRRRAPKYPPTHPPVGD